MPKDIKTTQELALRSFLDKLIGDEAAKPGDDSIREPIVSPIDFIPVQQIGALGAKGVSQIAKSPVVKSFVADAPGIIGNEIGSIGKNIKPKLPVEESTNINKVLMEHLERIAREEAPGPGKDALMAQYKNAVNRYGRDLKHSQQVEDAISSKNIRQEKFENLVNKLRKK
jgi:hypothetical protein